MEFYANVEISPGRFFFFLLGLACRHGIRWVRYTIIMKNSQQHGGIKMSLSIIYLIMENILYEPNCALDLHTHTCTLKLQSYLHVHAY